MIIPVPVFISGSMNPLVAIIIAILLIVATIIIYSKDVKQFLSKQEKELKIKSNLKKEKN